MYYLELDKPTLNRMQEVSKMPDADRKQIFYSHRCAHTLL